MKLFDSFTINIIKYSQLATGNDVFFHVILLHFLAVLCHVALPSSQKVLHICQTSRYKHLPVYFSVVEAAGADQSY